jgi:uncharacterized lipoprotein
MKMIFRTTVMCLTVIVLAGCAQNRAYKSPFNRSVSTETVDRTYYVKEIYRSPTSGSSVYRVR